MTPSFCLPILMADPESWVLQALAPCWCVAGVGKDFWIGLRTGILIFFSCSCLMCANSLSVLGWFIIWCHYWWWCNVCQEIQQATLSGVFLKPTCTQFVIFTPVMMPESCFHFISTGRWKSNSRKCLAIKNWHCLLLETSSATAFCHCPLEMITLASVLLLSPLPISLSCHRTQASIC